MQSSKTVFNKEFINCNKLTVNILWETWFQIPGLSLHVSVSVNGENESLQRSCFI